MFSFSSAGLTLSYQTSALRQGTLLYSCLHISVSMSCKRCSFLCQHISFKAAPLQLSVCMGLQGSSVWEAGNGFHGSSAGMLTPPEKAAQESVFPTCPAAFLPRLSGMQFPLHAAAWAAICCFYHVLADLLPLWFLSQEQVERLLWHAHRYGPSSPRTAQQLLLPNQTQPAII